MSRTPHHRAWTHNELAAFKKVRKRRRKAKEKQAMKNKDYEGVPVFKKSDKYDFY